MAAMIGGAIAWSSGSHNALADDQLVYWPFLTDGTEYRRIPYPYEAGTLLVLADTEVVIDARQVPVSAPTKSASSGPRPLPRHRRLSRKPATTSEAAMSERPPPHHTVVQGSEREGWWWFCVDDCHKPNQFVFRRDAEAAAAQHRRDQVTTLKPVDPTTTAF
jgi:hypothetical protein